MNFLLVSFIIEYGYICVAIHNVHFKIHIYG